MKKAFFLALSCLLMTICWIQPASAVGKIQVNNHSKYPARVSIVYYSAVCRDDHPLVAANSAWTVGSGACRIKDIVVVMKDTATGKDHVCVGDRGATSASTFQIYKRAPAGAFCQVMQGANFGGK